MMHFDSISLFSRLFHVLRPYPTSNSTSKESCKIYSLYTLRNNSLLNNVLSTFPFEVLTLLTIPLIKPQPPSQTERELGFFFSFLPGQLTSGQPCSCCSHVYKNQRQHRGGEFKSVLVMSAANLQGLSWAHLVSSYAFKVGNFRFCISPSGLSVCTPLCQKPPKPGYGSINFLEHD